jgi:D-alanyl-D-alanine carboxypeptidase/D-alanyl-D-alanine-endopeptidase (penicillin-binding protein 4)
MCDPVKPSRLLALTLTAAVIVSIAPPVQVRASARSTAGAEQGLRPPWTRTLDRLIGKRSFGVAVRENGAFLYRHQENSQRAPASNEKLLMSMALLDLLGPDTRLITQATSLGVAAGVVPGDLWILGQGDPSLGEKEMKALANAIRAAGVLRVEGSVMGSTAYFKRDWRAPGWKPSFRREEIALPTALTFEGNTEKGVHIRDPERLAATSLSKLLEKRGVRVAGKPGSGKPPAGLLPVAQIESPPLAELLEFANQYSSNFYAEVLGKRLGAEAAGAPGSIAKGAAAIVSWAKANGARVTSKDSSGLSYANRVSAGGIVRLLGVAELLPWGEALREGLAAPGEGTLEHRMPHLKVHAKTGTLTGISALSGWVFLRRERVWAEFSILSRGLEKDRAVRIEDAIVRVLSRSASL